MTGETNKQTIANAVLGKRIIQIKFDDNLREFAAVLEDGTEMRFETHGEHCDWQELEVKVIHAPSEDDNVFTWENKQTSF